MTDKDYKVMDMPTHLSRKALKQDPRNPNAWIHDDSWYRETREINFALYEFFLEHDLVNSQKRFETIDEVVLRYNDFNILGKLFLKSGAVDRWLASFDRPGSKKALSDVRYLEKALRAMSGTG